MTAPPIGRLALVWRGEPEARRRAMAENSRWKQIFAELAAANIHAEPAVYCEEAAGQLRDQLLRLDGTLVWVNPIQDGRTRFKLDALLREVAAHGVWISAHPDVTQKMGVKEVLHATRHLGWGTDTHLYRTAEALRDELPNRLRSAGPRVVKQNRGNGGQGVWKVEASGPGDVVEVLEAARGGEPRSMTLAGFMETCAAYFADGGCVIDQPFQERLPDGMIRCYMGVDKVVGFGHQLVKALLPPPPQGAASPEAQPGPRIMHPATAPAFQALRRKMETEWTPRMMQLLGISREEMPVIWDADFLYGPRSTAGEDTYVL
ncbi:MAG: Cj0069 family protein, partial [Acetobacteraceae bacterium]|nr:Cj0069 family protein [Acetobacteraceae bacterium]